MLTIDRIQNGIIIDHIRTGMGIKLYRLLELEQQGVPVALITGVHSKKYGTKDIIKIEGLPALPELGILAALDPHITVLRIENGEISERLNPQPPQRLTNIAKCGNARCITSCEEGIDHIFERSDHGQYRCIYCTRVLTLD